MRHLNEQLRLNSMARNQNSLELSLLLVILTQVTELYKNMFLILIEIINGGELLMPQAAL